MPFFQKILMPNISLKYFKEPEFIIDLRFLNQLIKYKEKSISGQYLEKEKNNETFRALLTHLLKN